MSIILDALKKAEKKKREPKPAPPAATERTGEPSGWQVAMVSPTRYVRFRAESPPDQQVNTPQGVRTPAQSDRRSVRRQWLRAFDSQAGVGILLAALVLLLLIECVLLYNIRVRTSAMSAEVKKVVSQVRAIETVKVTAEQQRQALTLQNDALRRELQAVDGDLKIARDDL